MSIRIRIAVAISTLATSAAAAADPAPYALTAVHAEFVAQLTEAGAMSGETGAAAREAATLMAKQNAAQERLVLPLLGWTDAVANGEASAPGLLPKAALETELSALFAGDVAVVTALADLFAAAETAGNAEIAARAERMIWHETTDVEVLYPAARLVAEAARSR